MSNSKTELKLAEAVPDKVSSEEMVYLREAQAALQNGQLLLNWVSGQLTRKYQLGPFDEIDLSTGIITRKTAASVE